VRLEGLGKLKKKFNGLIRNLTREIPDCSTEPHHLHYSVLSVQIPGSTEKEHEGPRGNSVSRSLFLLGIAKIQVSAFSSLRLGITEHKAIFTHSC
jgi:hypothetical protein